jgi:restriction endonuclease S subunit
MTWPLVRLDHLAPIERSAVDVRTLGDRVVLYSIPAYDSVGGPIEESTDSIGSAKQMLRGGEVLISKLNPRKSRVILVSPHDLPAVASTEFIALRPKGVDPEWLHYWLSSEWVRQQLDARVQSVTRSQQRVEPSDLCHLWLNLPTLREQRVMTNYLNAETSRLDAVIAAKRRFVGLVWERYIAEIDRACHAIGKFVALKRVAKVTYGLGQPPPLSEDGVALIRATNISKGSISDVDMIRASVNSIPLDRAPLLRAGEILVVRSGAYTGDSALIPKKWEGSAPGYDLRVTPFHIEPRFLAHQLLGRLVESQIDLVRSRAAQPHLNAEDLGQVQVVSTDESTEVSVAARLDRSRSRVDALLADLNRQILLLEERRQALIAFVVTGQVSIVGAA